VTSIPQQLLRRAVQIREIYARQKLVLVSGNFNLVHPGHIRLLNFARSCGDVLVVALFDDGEPGVMVQWEIRQEGLTSLTAVNHVVTVGRQHLKDFVLALQPEVVVKGKEHEQGENPEKDAVKIYGGHLIFSAGESHFSYADILTKDREDAARPKLRRARDFLKKHGLSTSRLKELLHQFAGKRVLVMGDLIVDEYIQCEAIGMSQEDPTIVVTPTDTQRFVGGAGIVSAHLVGMGAQVKLVTVCGDDLIADIAATSLASMGVEYEFFRDGSRPTTLKQRFRASGKTLLRVSHLRSHDTEEERVWQIRDFVEKRLQETDLLIFSDFNYGCLPQTLVDSISSLCTQRGIPFLADSQASSQVGDISRFKGAAMIAATEREARLAVNDFKSGIQNVANILMNRSAARSLVIKLGEQGCVIFKGEPGFETSSLRALNPNPVDVAGAGDAFLAAAGMALVSGGNVWENAYIGTISAALQISRLGNIPLRQSDLDGVLEDWDAEDYGTHAHGKLQPNSAALS
jgi:rfaE bifunctional protein kinase chain/domain